MTREHVPSLPERFRPIRLLGRGGMAEVWLAEDATTRSEVALKILLPHLRDDPMIVEKFCREVRIARRIVHPNVIRIFDLLQTEDVIALVLEVHHGVDLKHLLRLRGPLPWQHAVEVVCAVLDGLAAAHDQGVMHRDMKPHNVLVTEGVAGEVPCDVKITDFGLARVDDLIGVTMHTRAVGTIEYMAPEQLDAYLIDHRADLYAVGVMLYELITGKLPFRGHTPLAIAEQHSHAARPDVRDVVREVPEHVAQVIQQSMAIAPEDRFATARAMRAALQSVTTRRVKVRQFERSCPACGAPMIPHLDTCVECGFTAERLVREPGRGRCAVMVVGAWNKRELSQEQVNNLQALIRSIDALDESFEITWALSDPPYVLMDSLTEDDAHRLCGALEQAGVPARVIRPGVYGGVQRAWYLRLSLGHHLSFMFFMMFAWCPIFAITDDVVGRGNSDTAAVLGFGIIAGFYLLFWSLRVYKLGKPASKLREEATAQQETLVSRGVLPEQTTALLTALSSAQLRALVRRILGHATSLTASLEGRPELRAEIEPQLRHLLDAAMEHVARIVTIERTLATYDVQEIHTRLRELDEELAATDETLDAGDLINARVEGMRLLEEMDAIQHELTMRTGQLLHTSGALTELIEELHERTAHEHAVESVSVVLDELHLKLNAAHELEFSTATTSATSATSPPTKNAHEAATVAAQPAEQGATA